MVLLLLSLTLGLSYAAMRSQSTAGMIQRNSDRRASARQAAITGLSMALKKMHRSDWTGVDTSLSGSLSASESFLVTYTAGDATLSAGDSDQPYRVTLLSTGYAIDSEHVQSIATYKVRAVVRLIPRKLADEPADWATMLNYTVYQWAFGGFTMTVPARIEGPVRIQAILNLDWNYDWWGNPRDNYHTDLEKMREAGQGDYRPFSGQVTLDKSWQWWDTINVLKDRLKLTVVDASMRTITGMTFPSTLSTYRLYPGGKTYAIPMLPRTIQAAVYQPDPATNPAGLYFRLGALDVGDDTTIRGTVITTANSRGRITSPATRPASGRRPSTAAGHDGTRAVAGRCGGRKFQVGPNADVAITGLVSAYNNFEVLADSHTDITMSHQGKLIAQRHLFPRPHGLVQVILVVECPIHRIPCQEGLVNGIKYFPEWLKSTNRWISRTFDHQARRQSIRYHWHNPQTRFTWPIQRRRSAVGPAQLDGKPIMRGEGRGTRARTDSRTSPLTPRPNKGVPAMPRKTGLMLLVIASVLCYCVLAFTRRARPSGPHATGQSRGGAEGDHLQPGGDQEPVEGANALLRSGQVKVIVTELPKN